MRERDIERYLVERVKALGGEVRKVRWVGRRGAPDRVVMWRGYRGTDVTVPATVWVEVKAPGAKPEPHQAREHQRMNAMGQSVLVIDSIDAVDLWFR